MLTSRSSGSAVPTAVDQRLGLSEAISRAISLALLAGGLFTILLMAYSVYLTYTPLLWVDQWSFLQELVGNHGHYSISLLWKQHNDHRIPLPKLFYLADLYFFHGRNVLTITLIFGLQLLHMCWLVAVFRNTGKLREGALWTATALAAACLFSIMQSENFWFASDLPMVIPYFCATVAFSTLGFFCGKVNENGCGPVWMIGTVWASAAAAGLSLTNGLILWPMLIVLMVAMRLPSRIVIATLAVTALFIGIWRAGYDVPHAMNSGLSIRLLVRYVLILYSNSWPNLNQTVGMSMAAIAIPLVAGAYVWLLLKRTKDIFALVVLSIATFALASTIVTAIGRVSMGVEQARAGRYQTAAMLFWCSLFVLLIRAAARTKNPSVWLLPIQASLAWVILGTVHLAPQYTDGAKIHARSMQAALLAIDAGVEDSSKIMYVLVPPYRADDVLLLARFLKDHRWSIFAKNEEYPLGRSLSRYYRTVAPAACRGSLDEVTAIQSYSWPGYRVTGWAYDLADDSLPRAIILADSRGRIIGWAAPGFIGPKIGSSRSYFAPNDTGYIGYIPGDLESKDAMAYAILADGVSVCPLMERPTLLDLAATQYSGVSPTGLSRNLTLQPKAPVGVLESSGGTAFGETLGNGKTKPMLVGADAGTVLAGWMLDPELKAGSAMDLVVDGVPLIAEYGYERPDIAKQFSSSAARDSGFEARLPAMTQGLHTVMLRLIAADQDYYFESGPIRVQVR